MTWASSQSSFNPTENDTCPSLPLTRCQRLARTLEGRAPPYKGPSLFSGALYEAIGGGAFLAMAAMCAAGALGALVLAFGSRD
jgi:hypothetical protein